MLTANGGAGDAWALRVAIEGGLERLSGEAEGLLLSAYARPEGGYAARARLNLGDVPAEDVADIAAIAVAELLRAVGDRAPHCGAEPSGMMASVIQDAVALLEKWGRV